MKQEHRIITCIILIPKNSKTYDKHNNAIKCGQKIFINFLNT